MIAEDSPGLYWDATYAIVMALLEHYPEIEPGEIGLHELQHLVIGLPDFKDDPGLANERILMDIQITWFEEAKE
ncbi:MAG: Fe-S cluster assembly protein IscX [Chloroflexi bacterium]|jgi:FeS assembly protein IscX|nr:Fe-S cluster assembly protein IscX [Chloroflexota bacterium]